MSDLSPTARALRTLEILQDRPGTAADEFAERLGITERAARRYVGIRTVTQTPHEFTPPDGLDPVAALEHNLGTGWEFPTRVVYEAPFADVAPWIRPAMGRLEPLGEGSVLTGSTSNPTMYAQEFLALVPFPFRVEGGDELRSAVAQRFAAAVAA